MKNRKHGKLEKNEYPEYRMHDLAVGNKPNDGSGMTNYRVGYLIGRIIKCRQTQRDEQSFEWYTDTKKRR